MRILIDDFSIENFMNPPIYPITIVNYGRKQRAYTNEIRGDRSDHDRDDHGSPVLITSRIGLIQSCVKELNS